MSELYPFKFHPICKDFIWGGNKLQNKFNKPLPKNATKCAECWEISTIPDNISVVSNGYLSGNNLQELIEVYMTDLVGEKVYSQFGIEFPLLIKFIDANLDLSIQVHPDDETSKARHHAYGKTEMWYIIDNEPNSKIIKGFNRTITKEEFKECVDSNKIPQLLNYEDIVPNDIVFIPAGTIHAIGRGNLIAEIQQTSDVTYRVYDWERVDKNGKARELHTDLALDVISFNSEGSIKKNLPIQLNKTTELIKCKYFTTNRLVLNKSIGRDYNLLDSFVIYMCIEGELSILFDQGKFEKISAGETILIPADIKEIILKPIKQTKILEIFIE